MKYISFSLWGDKPIYNIGAIRNAEQSKEIYPDWKVIIYYDNSVPNKTINSLKKLDVELIDMSLELISGPFWRFLASDLNDCKYAIFRDTDSRISIREKLAVDEWILSGKSLHVMRDHPYHKIPAGNNELGILAGMWGIKGNLISINEMLTNFKLSNSYNYGHDQLFLKQIYSHYTNDMVIHDEFFENNPFPIGRNDERFIGERINEFEQPLTDDYKLIQNNTKI
jgi:hypothetical protein